MTCTHSSYTWVFKAYEIEEGVVLDWSEDASDGAEEEEGVVGAVQALTLA